MPNTITPAMRKFFIWTGALIVILVAIALIRNKTSVTVAAP